MPDNPKITATIWRDFKDYAAARGCSVLVKSERAFRSCKPRLDGSYRHIALVGIEGDKLITRQYDAPGTQGREGK